MKKVICILIAMSLFATMSTVFCFANEAEIETDIEVVEELTDIEEETSDFFAPAKDIEEDENTSEGLTESTDSIVNTGDNNRNIFTLLGVMLVAGLAAAFCIIKAKKNKSDGE